MYYSELGNYKKVLKEKNILLREENRDKGLYAVFDEALAEYGIRIAEARKKFIERLNEISKELHTSISGGTEDIKHYEIGRASCRERV